MISRSHLHLFVLLFLSLLVANACNQDPAPAFDEKAAPEKPRQNQTEYNHLEQGALYAAATGTVLMQNLIGAIEGKGTAAAVEFCNTRAIPLTDSMAAEQGIRISRASDQPRNPQNQANEHQQLYIRKAKASFELYI